MTLTCLVLTVLAAGPAVALPVPPVLGLVLLDNGEVIPGNICRVDDLEVEISYPTGRVILPRRRCAAISVDRNDDVVRLAEVAADPAPEGTPPAEALAVPAPGEPCAAPTAATPAPEAAPRAEPVPAPAAETAPTFTLSDGRVRLAYPAGWTVQERDGVVTFVEPLPAGERAGRSHDLRGQSSLVLLILEGEAATYGLAPQDVWGGPSPVVRSIEAVMGVRGATERARPDGAGGLRVEAVVNRFGMPLQATTRILGEPGLLVVAVTVRPEEPGPVAPLLEAALESVEIVR